MPEIDAIGQWLFAQMGLAGLTAIFLVFLTVGLWIVVARALAAGTDLILRANLRWRRIHHERASDWPRRLEKHLADARNPLTVGALGIGGALGIFLLPQSLLMGATLLVLGVTLARYGIWRERQRRSRQLTLDVEQFLQLFLPLYETRLHHGHFLPFKTALQGSGVVLRQTLAPVVRSVEIGKSARTVYQDYLKQATNPYLISLLTPLASLDEASPETVLQSLRRLANRLLRRRRLADRAKVSLAMLRGSLRFLQLANAAAIAAVVLTPGLRAWYLEAFTHQLMFSLLATFVVGAGIFFEEQLRYLEERVL